MSNNVLINNALVASPIHIEARSALLQMLAMTAKTFDANEAEKFSEAALRMYQIMNCK